MTIGCAATIGGADEGTEASDMGCGGLSAFGAVGGGGASEGVSVEVDISLCVRDRIVYPMGEEDSC